jgi:hypothetical protein
MPVQPPARVPQVQFAAAPPLQGGEYAAALLNGEQADAEEDQNPRALKAQKGGPKGEPKGGAKGGAKGGQKGGPKGGGKGKGQGQYDRSKTTPFTLGQMQEQADVTVEAFMNGYIGQMTSWNGRMFHDWAENVEADQKEHKEVMAKQVETNQSIAKEVRVCAPYPIDKILRMHTRISHV